MSHFVVTHIPVVITNDPSRPKRGVIRDAFVEVFHGRFLRVGEMRELPVELCNALEGGAIQEVSGEGRIVTPGLMHGHTHLSQTLWRGRGQGKTLLEWLRDVTWPSEAAMTPEDLAISAHYGAAEVLSHGGTTCLDMATVHHTLDYAREGILKTGLRVWTGNVVMDCMDDEVPFPRALHERPTAALRKTEETLRELERLSKATNGRVNPAVTMRFLLTSEEETARALAEMARGNGWPLQTHASESPGEVAAIRARFGRDNIEKLHELAFLGRQTFLHHVVHPTEDEIRLMWATQTTAVWCPGSNGMLGSGISPVDRLLEAGVSVAIGSDGAPCNDMLNLRADMWAAMVLAGASRQRSNAVTPEQIFEMATTAGMRGLGRRDLGRIARFYRADLVFWNQDDWDSFVDLEDPGDVIGRMARTTGQRATDVFVDGQQVFAKGNPLFIGDRTLFREEVNRAARSLAERAEKHRVPIPFLERQGS